MSKISIDKDCCKGCFICLTVCPKGIFKKTKKRNKYGTTMPEAVNTDECVQCRMCERMCPDGAINVEGGDNNEN